MFRLNTKSPANPETELTRFFLIAFIWSWLFWTPRVLASAGLITLPGVLDFILSILAVFGPGAAAFWLTWRSQGRSGVRTLWLRGWTVNFNWRWLLVPILLMPLIGGLTTLTLHFMEIDLPWEVIPAPAMIAPLFLLLYLGAMATEYGWRGFAFARMQTRSTPLQASLILGLTWGLWHLPLHYIAGSAFAAIPMWQLFLQTTALSVLYTWLYNKTGASVLIVILFSAFSGLTGALLPTWASSAGRWITFLLTIGAIVGLAMFTGMRKYQRS